MPERCVVGGCCNVRKKGEVALFRWPEDDTLAHSWDRFVRLQRVDFIHTKWSVICSDHFRDDDFLNLESFRAGEQKCLSLKKSSVPQLRNKRHGEMLSGFSPPSKAMKKVEGCRVEQFRHNSETKATVLQDTLDTSWIVNGYQIPAQITMDTPSGKLQTATNSDTKSTVHYLDTSGILNGNQIPAQITMDRPTQTQVKPQTTTSSDTKETVHTLDTSLTELCTPVITIEPTGHSCGDILKQSDGDDTVNTYYVHREPSDLPVSGILNRPSTDNLIQLDRDDCLRRYFVQSEPGSCDGLTHEEGRVHDGDLDKEANHEQDRESDHSDEEEDLVTEPTDIPQPPEIEDTTSGELRTAVTSRLRRSARKKPREWDEDREGVGKMLICALCKESFTNRSSYISHVVEHTTDTSSDKEDSDYKEDAEAYSCEVCYEIFEDEDVFQEHLSQGHEAFQCPECPLKFPTRDDKDAHLRTVHDLWPCNFCDKVFETKAELKAHRLEEKFPCAKCGKVLKSLGALKGHMTLHSDSRQNLMSVCELCKKVYCTPQNLALHKRTVHANLPQRYKCDTCGKAFKFPNYLKKHKTIHQSTNEACPVCGKIFSSRTNLLAHMRLHTDHRPHCCDVCGKRFKTMAQLRGHMSWHSEERNHVCEVCGARFQHIGSFRRHLRSHTGPKQHQCPVCGKAFRQRGHLAQHEVIHLPQKPYECDICHKRFPQKPYVKIHKRKVHPEYTR